MIGVKLNLKCKRCGKDLTAGPYEDVTFERRFTVVENGNVVMYGVSAPQFPILKYRLCTDCFRAFGEWLAGCPGRSELTEEEE